MLNKYNKSNSEYCIILNEMNVYSLFIAWGVVENNNCQLKNHILLYILVRKYK